MPLLYRVHVLYPATYFSLVASIFLAKHTRNVYAQISQATCCITPFYPPYNSSPAIAENSYYAK